jgi:hypothetical protein
MYIEKMQFVLRITRSGLKQRVPKMQSIFHVKAGGTHNSHYGLKNKQRIS